MGNQASEEGQPAFKEAFLPVNEKEMTELGFRH